jgi:hypothetical protein
MSLSTFTNKVGEFLSAGLAGLRVDGDAPSFLERRAYARARVPFAGSVDADGHRLAVRGIDLHRAGARISLDQPLPAGTVVFLFDKSHGLMGWATVRWGSWHGHKYHLGLEFRHPLMRAEAGTWQFSCVLSVPELEDAGRA